MYIPEIPNNSLTEEIKEIVSLCMKLKSRYGKNSTWFDSKSNDEDIINLSNRVKELQEHISKIMGE
mgnify:CR=1 FL=1